MNDTNDELQCFRPSSDGSWSPIDAATHVSHNVLQHIINNNDDVMNDHRMLLSILSSLFFLKPMVFRELKDDIMRVIRVCLSQENEWIQSIAVVLQQYVSSRSGSESSFVHNISLPSQIKAVVAQVAGDSDDLKWAAALPLGSAIVDSRSVFNDNVVNDVDAVNHNLFKIKEPITFDIKDILASGEKQSLALNKRASVSSSANPLKSKRSRIAPSLSARKSSIAAPKAPRSFKKRTGMMMMMDSETASLLSNKKLMTEKIRNERKEQRAKEKAKKELAAQARKEAKKNEKKRKKDADTTANTAAAAAATTTTTTTTTTPTPSATPTTDAKIAAVDNKVSSTGNV